jgi:hypothetical protein
VAEREARVEAPAERKPGTGRDVVRLAVAEIGGYVLFTTAGVALVTFACIAGGAGMKLLTASGKPKP